MKKKLFTPLLAATLLATTSPCFASRWYFLWAGNNQYTAFFDAETIERSKDSVTVWLKFVQTTTPSADGSWALATRWRMNCTKRTIQYIASSTYDRDNKFIRSNNNIGIEDAVTPDTAGEKILKVSCEPGFPKSNSDSYFRIEHNDVFLATRVFAETMNSQVDNAPK